MEKLLKLLISAFIGLFFFTVSFIAIVNVFYPLTHFVMPHVYGTACTPESWEGYTRCENTVLTWSVSLSLISSLLPAWLLSKLVTKQLLKW